jgi:hypothetical protein
MGLCNLFLFFFFWKYWGLNLGLHAGLEVALPLEQCLHLFLLWLFLWKGLTFCTGCLGQ